MILPLCVVLRMEHTALQFVRAFLLSVCWVSVAYAQSASSEIAQRNHPTINTAIPMPKGFENVFLGMPRDELLKRRKLSPLPGRSKINLEGFLLTENVSASPYIDTALYLMSPNNDVGGIALYNEVDGKHIKRYYKAFLQGAWKLWGKKHETYISKMSHARQREYEAITLVWQMDKLYIACTLPHAATIRDSEVVGFAVRIGLGNLKERGRLRLIEHPAQLNLADIKKELAELAREKTLPAEVFE